MGLIGLAAYFIGLGIILLLIAHFGRNIIGRFAFFVNPHGMFRRVLGIIILIVGLLVVTGYIKKVETYIIERNIFINTLALDNTLNDIILKHHNNTGGMCANGKCDEGKDGGLLMDAAKAPELTGIATWINSNPLTIESLRGKVVLIDFWTYSCINCQRTQPYLNAWYEKYRDNGLVIIGVHAPEFGFEKIETNVREASQKAGIKYPIALDNDFKTWNAYWNRYWPAKYLIDQKGNIIFKHFWEGGYDEMEKNIQDLLWAKKDFENLKSSTSSDSSSKKELTPETYLGSARAERISLVSGSRYKNGNDIFVPAAIEKDYFTLSGGWLIADEYIESRGMSELRLRFSAKKVYLVVSFPEGTDRKDMFLSIHTLESPGKDTVVKKVDITSDGLYEIFSSDTFVSDGTLTLYVPNFTPLRLHAFTFWD